MGNEPSAVGAQPAPRVEGAQRQPLYWDKACTELAARDPVMARLIEDYGGEQLASHGDPFVTLARAIVGQQVSVVAADQIWNRLVAVLDGAVDPLRLLATDEALLRCAGLSGRKVAYLRDLAYHAQRWQVSRWPHCSDKQLIELLTAVRGIGRWTAEMFLIFHLLRPDVWPADDLGLRRALVRFYGLAEKQPLAAWRAAGDRFRPWRTVATWYLWRALDPVPVAY